ncbi:protein of unknown function [Methylocella tundrae]|uniref:Uncharacterized protein n=1 Tax=Methylocella tundrae TaxID=227605 RepID=A0A4U8YX86_METTU|nr:protein of unknown function [Methylocella tundrae]
MALRSRIAEGAPWPPEPLSSGRCCFDAPNRALSMAAPVGVGRVSNVPRAIAIEMAMAVG